MTGSPSNAMRRLACGALAALLTVGASLPAVAQWKWRDRSGHTQYSDLAPPPGTPEQDILQRPAAAQRTAPAPAPSSAASTPPLPAARASDADLEARRKQVETDAANKKKAEDARNAQIRADNCARAKDQMRTLDSGVRVTRTNARGEREFMDDSARAAEVQRTQAAIASECR